VSWIPSFAHSVAIVAILAITVGGYLLAHFASDRRRERGAPPHEVRGIRIIVAVVAGLFVLGIAAVSFGPLTTVSGLALSAVGGLAATLALQTTLANLVAGVILLRSKVLRVNDGIEISGVKGRVVQIGLVTTWLRLEDGGLATVSHSTLLSGPLINRSAGDRLKGEY
jgi:small-conductance mechanosensitive channel